MTTIFRVSIDLDESLYGYDILRSLMLCKINESLSFDTRLASLTNDDGQLQAELTSPNKAVMKLTAENEGWFTPTDMYDKIEFWIDVSNVDVDDPESLEGDAHVVAQHAFIEMLLNYNVFLAGYPRSRLTENPFAG